MCPKSLQLHPTLQHRDCNPQSSSVHEIFQTRILECIAKPPPEDLPDPGIEPMPVRSPGLAVGSLPLGPTERPQMST